MAQKIRPDLQTLIDEYNVEMGKPAGSRQVTRLEKFIVALQKLQDSHPDKGDLSFFYLASYHGYSTPEIFTQLRKDVPAQFKNSIFCPHGLPEFPAWHRVVISKYEKALQNFESSVMLPFWNETSSLSQTEGYPPLLSKDTFTKADGSTIRNSLKSFNFTEDINFNGIHVPNEHLTSRNPKNLLKYLSTQIVSDVKTAMKQTTYELFSHNGQSFQSSLETPHNNVHNYIGDWMPEVPVSSFDPIFWLHHCFIDLLFWQWQVKNNMTTQINYPQNYLQLVPFKNQATGSYYTINDVANISQFGYSYPAFNFEELGSDSRRIRRELFAKLGKPVVHKTEGSDKILTIGGIRFSRFGGSFKVDVEVKTLTGKIPLGSQSVFRAPSECNNCDVRPMTQVSFRMKNIPKSEENNLQFKIRFILKDSTKLSFKVHLSPGERHVHNIMGIPLELVF